METINVKLLNKHAIAPTRAHSWDAGLDLYASEDVPYKPDTIVTVSTGVAMAVPVGYVGLVRDRSSVSKQGLKVTAGVVDAGYTGEIGVVILNLSNQHGCIRKGQKIAQILLLPVSTPLVAVVDELPSSTRGDKGFGSSGA